MKRFLKTCYRCGAGLREATILKEGVPLYCMRCPSCGEEYFTSSELIRFDILTGRRSDVRTFGTLGDSTILRLPPAIVARYGIKPKDLAVFEERSDGILIRPVGDLKNT